MNVYNTWINNSYVCRDTKYPRNGIANKQTAVRLPPLYSDETR